VPTYEGRLYGKGHARCNFRKFYKKGFKETCRAIEKHYSNREGVFISHEGFSSLRHQHLFEILGDDWDVLVVKRNLHDLIQSRLRHKPHDFFLYDKIKRGTIDAEVKRFYDPESLKKGFSHLTVLSFEKLFSGEKEELDRLSKYLGHDIGPIFRENISRRKNSRKK
tara:strand:- start:9428 stop:9925 length:498 start_codon:yes stop_codon:yes gene_type:complete